LASKRDPSSPLQRRQHLCRDDNERLKSRVKNGFVVPLSFSEFLQLVFFGLSL
jgi:hypothetical protein